MAQSQVIGAFFYGYIVSQVPGGRLAEIFGAKLIFAMSLGAIAVLNLLVDITYMLISRTNATNIFVVKVYNLIMGTMIVNYDSN